MPNNNQWLTEILINLVVKSQPNNEFLPTYDAKVSLPEITEAEKLILQKFNEAIMNDYLDQCFPMSDHDDIRNGNYTGGGFISENIILDRIKALHQASLNKEGDK